MAYSAAGFISGTVKDPFFIQLFNRISTYLAGSELDPRRPPYGMMNELADLPLKFQNHVERVLLPGEGLEGDTSARRWAGRTAGTSWGRPPRQRCCCSATRISFGSRKVSSPPRRMGRSPAASCAAIFAASPFKMKVAVPTSSFPTGAAGRAISFRLAVEPGRRGGFARGIERLAHRSLKPNPDTVKFPRMPTSWSDQNTVDTAAVPADSWRRNFAYNLNFPLKMSVTFYPSEGSTATDTRTYSEEILVQAIQTLSMTQHEDDRLARQAVHNPDAFAELYERHFVKVYRYHLAHSGDASEAQDLTSQTWMAALEGIPGYRGTGSFSAWLLGIARRKQALHFRQRRPQAGLDAAPGAGRPRPVPGEPGCQAAGSLQDQPGSGRVGGRAGRCRGALPVCRAERCGGKLGHGQE